MAMPKESIYKVWHCLAARQIVIVARNTANRKRQKLFPIKMNFMQASTRIILWREI